MSYVCAVVLMMINDPQEAFWIFASIVEYGLKGITSVLSLQMLNFNNLTHRIEYYVPSMGGLLRDASIFQLVLESEAPIIATHLVSIHFNIKRFRKINSDFKCRQSTR
jgi:hypothetical protein